MISTINHSDVQAWVAELATQPWGGDRAICPPCAAWCSRRCRQRQDVGHQSCSGSQTSAASQAAEYLFDCAQLDLLAKECGRYRSLVLLLGVGGLRWSEAAALRVSDIDFLRRRVNLHRDAVRVGPQFVVGSLKSGKSRHVVLPRFVIDALAQTAEGKGRDDLLWTTAAGGYVGAPTERSWLAGAVSRCQKADPSFSRVTDHDLRHTAASLAIHPGANPKVVQRMLGHASAALTLDVYADLFESDLDSVAEKVGKMWAEGVEIGG